MIDGRRALVALKSALLLLGTLLVAPAATAGATEADPLYVASYIEVRPGSSGKGNALIASYARAAAKEQGNHGVTALQDVERAGRFVVVESWSDQAALASHEVAASSTALLEGLKAIERSPVDRRVHHGFALDAMPAAAGANALYTVTHVDVPAAKREDAETLLKTLTDAWNSDPRKLRYDVYQQVDPRTNHFTVVAAWKSRAAFDAAASQPYWLQFMAGIGPLVGAPYDERLFRLIPTR